MNKLTDVIYKKTIVLLYLMVFVAGGLFGLCADLGLCVALWGSDVVDKALANPPDRAYLAFWVWSILIAPSIAFGFVGAAFVLVLVANRLGHMKYMKLSHMDKIILNFVCRSFESIKQHTGSALEGNEPNRLER